MMYKAGTRVEVTTDLDSSYNDEGATGVVIASNTIGIKLRLTDIWECGDSCLDKGEEIFITWRIVKFVRKL